MYEIEPLPAILSFPTYLTVLKGIYAFIFDFQSKLPEGGHGRASRARISPKLNFYYQAAENVRLYLCGGFGFHSNDARAVVSGEAGNSLPRAFGYETGSTFTIGKKLLFNISCWGLELQNELVYSGDEGIVEISGATRRLGTDFAFRW